MKGISTSTFNFGKIISNGFLYVDKTEYVHKLARPAFGEYFLSRPRRFGKSLLIPTLKAADGQDEHLEDGQCQVACINHNNTIY